jgi:hypothetical protein
MKEQIEKFKMSGGVYIWKYADNDRNYSGWNMTVDDLASQKLSQLLDMMEKCEWSTSKKVLTTKPTTKEISVPNNRDGRFKWTTKSKVVLSLKTNETPDYWTMIETIDELEISFGIEKLQRFKDSIINIPRGKGDYSIADEDGNSSLTFWWRVK